MYTIWEVPQSLIHQVYDSGNANDTSHHGKQSVTIGILVHQLCGCARLTDHVRPPQAMYTSCVVPQSIVL